MIDLHTHILPGMDDGAKDVEMSLEMLRMQQAQGVDTVALTSHFYPSRESSRRFLQRRAESAKVLAQAVLALPAEEQARMAQKLILGAEVAWAPNLAYDDNLDQMCLGSSRYMLLELPFEPWSMQMIDQIYHLSTRTGITPVIAHLDRYQKLQKRELFEEILALGVPVQIGTDMLFGGFFEKRAVLNLLREGHGFFLASDCHNLQTRKPNLGDALKVAEKKLGREVAEALQRQAEDILR